MNIKGIIKSLWYRVRYRNSIVFDGMPNIEGSAKINLKKGLTRIGKGLSMKTNSYLAIIDGGSLMIGSHVSIARNSLIVCHDCITIGDHCAIAPNVVIYDHDHKFGIEGIRSGYNTAPVVIGNNCWIGAGVTILRGSHIGEGCVIGAGCIIKGNIPAHSLVTQNRELNVVPIEDRK